MEIEKLLVKFKELSIKNYNATLEGEYRIVNSTLKELLKIVEIIKEKKQLNLLMGFFNDENEGVVSKAATFCLASYPNESLKVFKKLAETSKTIIGFGASSAIKHWEDGTWNIG